jgi:hypothetical protein
MAQELERLVVSLQADLSNFTPAMANVATQAEQASSKIVSEFQSANSSLGALAAQGFGLGAGISIFNGLQTAVIAAITYVGQLSSEFAKFETAAKRANLALDEFQALRIAAQQNGVSGSAFDTGVENLAQLLNDGAREANDLTKFLDANKVKWKDTEGEVISVNQLLQKMGDLIKNAKTEQDKINFVGIAGLTKDWISLLEQGGPAIEKMADAARDGGGIVDEALIHKAAEFDREWNKTIVTWTTFFKAQVVTISDDIERLIGQSKVLADGLRSIEGFFSHQLPVVDQVKNLGADVAYARSELEKAAASNSLEEGLAHLRKASGAGGTSQLGFAFNHPTPLPGQTVSQSDIDLSNQAHVPMFRYGLGDVPSQYQSTFQAAANQYGIDPAWLASIAHAESGFNPGLTSPAGAQGMMQFMPGTAAQYGVGNAFDPSQAVPAAAHYLSDLLNQVGGSLSKATAAYNFGPGNVASGQNYPTETQQYLGKVFAPGVSKPGTVPALPPAQEVKGFTQYADTPNDFTKMADAIAKRTEALKADTAAVGLSTEAAAKAKIEEELLAAAKKAGLDIDDELKDKINLVSQAYADQAVALERAKNLQGSFNAANQYANSFFQDIIVNGTTAQQALSNLLKRMAADLLQFAFTGQGALAPLFGQSYGQTGGLFGALFGGLIHAGGPPTAAVPFAKGGTLDEGNWGLVGEEGPELIRAGRFPITVQPMRGGGYSGGNQMDVRVKIDPSPLFHASVDKKISDNNRTKVPAIVADRQARFG